MLLPVLFLMATKLESGAPGVPARQPQLAAGPGITAMAFGAGKTIYFASSADKGKTFGAPVKVAELGALHLGRHRGPRLAILASALVITAVVGDKAAEEKPGAGLHVHKAPEAGDLVAFRSVDRGKTWIRSGVVNDVPNSAREGLHAMATDGKATIFTAWLDLRGKGTKLYGAKSTDGGVTWKKNVEVYSSPDGTICQCCDPSVAIEADGRIWAMWRNVIDGDRDLWAVSSKDGVTFKAAQKLGEGSWKLNACPMDGGGFAVTESGDIVSAWRRGSDVYLAEPGAPEKKLGTGKDVAMARGKKGTYVAWTVSAKDATGIQIAAPGGSPTQLAAEGAFVNLLALPDGSILAAWEAHDSIETKRLN